MTTYSQVVDAIIVETRRPDLMSEIRTYVNQTIREMHFRPDNNAVILYRNNLVEDTLTATSDSGLTWTLPSPNDFQFLSAVQYGSVHDRDNRCNGVYVQERTPGRSLVDMDYYWYRASDYVVFHGYGGINSIVNIAYYQYPRRLKYYELALRPATWDDESGWTYLGGITTDDDKLAARAKVTNWLLQRWPDVILEGTRAKVYKRISDDTRARTSYSLYAQLRMGIYTSETMEQGVY